jgi:hypothetical protein
LKKEHVWILVSVVLLLVLLGVVAGWAWSAGAAVASAAAGAKIAAELAAREKSKTTIVEAQEDVDDALSDLESISDRIDVGTVDIEKEISAMTPEEKIALAKELLVRAES